MRLDDDELETHYRIILTVLGTGKGLIPTIFRKAQNRVQDPAKLKRLVTLIDGENWSRLDVDVKTEIYEGLLEKNAQDVKSGAGQYFTLRPSSPYPSRSACSLRNPQSLRLNNPCVVGF